MRCDGDKMAIVKKQIKDTIYKYEVKYDRKTKKQKWKIIDKWSLDPKIYISEMFTKKETEMLKFAYRMAKRNRYDKIRDILNIVLDRIKTPKLPPVGW